MKRKIAEIQGEAKKIAIIAPASKSNSGDDEAKLTQAINYLQQIGSPAYPNDIFQGDALPFLAASASRRAKHLLTAIKGSDVEIIWAYRGGVGCLEACSKLLDSMEFEDLISASKKVFVGFSDCTVIHSLINQLLGWPSIHGPVLHSIIGHQASMQAKMIEVLKGADVQLPLKSANNISNVSEISGIVTGGNLTVLASMVGTRLELNMRDKVVLFEDVGEPSYKLYRCFEQLAESARSNFFQAKALIFCDFTGHDEFLQQTIEYFIEHYASDIPCFYAGGIGHGEQNMPVIMGAVGEIAGEGPVLTIANPFDIEFDAS